MAKKQINTPEASPVDHQAKGSIYPAGFDEIYAIKHNDLTMLELQSLRAMDDSWNDSTGLYVPDGKPNPLLTQDGERYLFGMIDRFARPMPGETPEGLLEAYWAKNKLVECNLRMVGHAVKRNGTVFRGEKNDDLFMAGVTGLMWAIRKFEITSGNKFYTYAITWVQRDVGKAVKALSTPFGFSLDNNLEEFLSLPTVGSLEAPLNGENQSTLKDLLGSGDQDLFLAMPDLHGYLYEAISHLPSLMKEVILLEFFSEGLIKEQRARALGISEYVYNRRLAAAKDALRSMIFRYLPPVEEVA